MSVEPLLKVVVYEKNRVSPRSNIPEIPSFEIWKETSAFLCNNNLTQKMSAVHNNNLEQTSVSLKITLNKFLHVQYIWTKNAV